MTIKRLNPGPGQESVWNFPRPPALEDCSKRVRVGVGGVTIANSENTNRVLDTSHPPVYYIPPHDIETDCLVLAHDRSCCEWKGEARYYSVVASGKTFEKVARFYANPTQRFAGIEGQVAFYPSKMGACYVDEEKFQAIPQSLSESS